MQRHHQEYQTRKLAWQLINSPEWRDLLLPLLSIEKTLPDIVGPESSYEAARIQAEKQFVKNLILKIERKAKEFTDTKVDGAPAPIVVPE